VIFEASAALALAAFAFLATAIICVCCSMTTRYNVMLALVTSLCGGVLSLAASSLLGAIGFLIEIIR